MATRTVTELARALGVTTQTIRTWTEHFADFLSPLATPRSGETRSYSEDDVSVLALVGELRARSRGFEEIRQVLEEGRRGRLPEQDQSSEEMLYPPVPVLAAQLARREGELEAIREERDRLLKELEAAREARLDAERRAAAADAEARLLRELREVEQRMRGSS